VWTTSDRPSPRPNLSWGSDEKQDANRANEGESDNPKVDRFLYSAKNDRGIVRRRIRFAHIRAIRVLETLNSPVPSALGCPIGVQLQCPAVSEGTPMAFAFTKWALGAQATKNRTASSAKPVHRLDYYYSW
jgi:hypothetical protein